MLSDFSEKPVDTETQKRHSQVMANLMKLTECRSWIGAWWSEASLSRAAREFKRAATEQKANLEAMARLGRCKPSDLAEYSQCVAEIEAARDKAESKLRDSPPDPRNRNSKGQESIGGRRR